MEPHTSSYLSKYFVKLFRYRDDGMTITSLAFTLARCMLECSTNDSLLWNQNAVSSLTSVKAHSK